MPDQDIAKVSPKEAFEQVGQAVITGAIEVMKLHPGFADNPGAQVFMAVLGPVLGLSLGRGAYGLVASRVPKLTEGYAKAFDNDAAKVADHAAKHEDDSNFNDLMYRSFRLMMDAYSAPLEH